jgi:hypothetical protein
MILLPKRTSLPAGFAQRLTSITVAVFILLAPTIPALANPVVTYDISTCAELNDLGQDNATATDTINLAANIDCTGIDFAPMYSTDGFSGTLDGQNHQITNLVINRPSDGNVGLISYTDNASIKRLILSTGHITGSNLVGAVAGKTTGTTIDHVTSHLDVDAADNYVGGLVGALEATTAGHPASLTNSSSTGNITTTSGRAGGLIGYTQNANADVTVSRSFATGSVTGSGGNMGGVIGSITDMGGNSTTIIADVYAAGAVSGPSDVGLGGLIGTVLSFGGGPDTSLVAIHRTYASGTVTGRLGVGGLIGVIGPSDSNSFYALSDSFASGAVTAGISALAGALVGSNGTSDPVDSANNYFDQTSTGYANCTTNTGLTDCNAKLDPSWFQGNYANAPMSAWDFANIWRTNTGAYPTFVNIDSDGVSTAVEDAAPNSGDANGDGITDSEQADIASFVDFVTNHYVSLAVEGCNVASANVAAESASSADVAYDYPAGLVNFSAVCGTVGATITASQYFYGLSVSPTNIVARKYNPTTHGYAIIPGATVTQVTIGGASVIKVTYQITDGGPLDTDGAADGTITDPAGPAVLVVGVPNTGFGGLQH